MTFRWPVLALALSACTPSLGEPPAPPEPVDEWDEKLGERVVDYHAALRIAALRLTGDLPTLAQMDRISAAPDDAGKRLAYEAQIREYIASPVFARQMFLFWQDAFKMGGDTELDSAPAFAAQLVIENRSYLELFTATRGTCPTFDVSTGRFVAADCANGVATVGVLTHPGVQRHFFGNLAFRRVRWVQETFACTKFPAEVADAPELIGGSTYTGRFPFDSIAGEGNGGRVDFLDTAGDVCANCHSNMNHVAPLFAYFDANGFYQSAMAVPTPLPDAPPAVMGDFLPPGEGLAWRSNVPIADMASLGRAMAADPDIAECAVARVWNWAMGKSDIVDGGARVPAETIKTHVDAFVANGHRLRDAIFAVYTSDDFVRF